MIIEIQYIKECPNAAEMIRRIKMAMAGRTQRIDYRQVLVESNKDAAGLKFRGSPTLLINGRDLEDLPEPETPFIACRFYPGGLPSIEAVKKKIDLAFFLNTQRNHKV